MNTTVKAVNYSDAQIERMISVYQEVDSDEDRKMAVESIAKEFGKTVNSVRAKLAGLKVYIKPAKTTKAGIVSVAKAELVTSIAKEIGMSEEQADSLSKATKNVLLKIDGRLKAQAMNVANLEKLPE